MVCKRRGSAVGSEIKTPDLRETTPPYFDIHVGHMAKVIEASGAAWVQIVDIRGDDFLGIVRPREQKFGVERLKANDVISFERQHIFGMY